MIGLGAADSAVANAWGQPTGRGQLILKADRMTATQGYGPDGFLAALPADRRDASVGVLAEYGVADGITVQFKGDWQSGEDAFVDYDGRGPVEVGVTWRAWRDDTTSISLYGGYATGGEGRNAGYAAPGEGESDWEVRASVGRSIEARGWAPRSFVEVQAARRMRSGLADETRVDATAGVHVGRDWMVLAQAFGGQADGSGPRWLSTEITVVRDLGPWSVQAGWREAVSGRETPQSGGPVIAVWRRF